MNRIINFPLFCLLFCAQSNAIAHVGIKELEVSWTQYSNQLKLKQANNSIKMPMDFESVYQINVEASKTWEKVLECFSNNALGALQAYQNKDFSHCNRDLDLAKEIARIHLLVKQFMITSDVANYKASSELPPVTEQMIHPLFTQVLLEEIAKFSIIAKENTPGRPKKIGVCLGILSIGWCEDRPEPPRSEQMSNEEKNMLFSLRFLPLEKCKLGLFPEESYLVLVGVMNGFGIDTFGNNMMVVRHGNGVFYTPRAWAEDAAFVMQGSFAAYSYSLQKKVRDACGASRSGNSATALEQFRSYSEFYLP